MIKGKILGLTFFKCLFVVTFSYSNFIIFAAKLKPPCATTPVMYNPVGPSYVKQQSYQPQNPLPLSVYE